MCFMVNKDWCDSGTVTLSCSPNLGLLSIKCRLHLLSRELTLIIITAVYIPPQASTEAALSDLQAQSTELLTDQ